MIEDVAELVLDGNAAAGLLQEIFVPDITIAQIQCETCGTVVGVGSLRLYAAPMGAILRLPLRQHSHEGGQYTTWLLD